VRVGASRRGTNDQKARAVHVVPNVEAPVGVGACDRTHDGVAASERRHESGFVQTACAQRRDGTTLTALRALTLTTITADTEQMTTVEDRTEWFAALGDIFDIRLDNVAGDARDRLWRSANESHDRQQTAAEPVRQRLDDER
jgi:hypothetical protein